MAWIKGKWRWNEVIDDNVYYFNQAITFQSNGTKFARLYVHWSTGITTIQYIKDSYNDYVYFRACYDGENETILEDYRVMDFGDTEQEISEELYAFIDDNATEYSPIAEKLEKIADNVQKVFDAGKQQGHGEGYDSGYDAGLEEGKELGGYNEGFEAGKQEENDAFWDVVQQGGRRTAYDVAFCWWDCEYLHPKYKVVPTSGANAARNIIYRCAKLKKIEAAYFDLSKVPNTTTTYDTLGYLFGLCDELEEIEDVGLQAPLFLNYFCYSDKKLKKIAVIRIAEETQVNNMLYYCPELEYVRIEGVIGQSGIDLKYSTKLSKESIESIVNHLSDTAEGKSLTLSKAAVDKAFETSEGANDGASSQEWDSLEGLKMNWEITLV